MKKFIRSTMAIAAVLAVAAVAFGVRPSPSTVVIAKKTPVANEPGHAGPTAAAAALNYSTGFEDTDGFVPGHINNQPAALCPLGPGCWKRTAAANGSIVQGHISTVHPFGGTQHLRLDYDPATRTNQPAFGLGVDARSCGGATTTCVPNTGTDSDISLQMAMLPFGQDYKIQPQSVTVAVRDAVILFFYTGSIYMEDLNLDQTALVLNPAGFWDTTGGYQPVLVDFSLCDGVIRFTYGSTGAYTATLYSEAAVEQLLVFGDNFPGPNVDGSGAPCDFDDVIISTNEAACPQFCGDNIIQTGETCEPGLVPNGCNADDACGDVGTATECQCARICTLDAPCFLNNGTNGPFQGPFDAQFGGIFVYDPADAVSVELCGSTGIDTFIQYWGSCSDPADPGASNDDCCDAADPNCGTFGAGSDPGASCYNNVSGSNYESCTCHDNPIDGDNCYILQTNGGNSNTATFTIEINKKAVCGGGHLGSCCDTNGADTGCTDSVLSGDCSGADKVWTENGKCATTQCDCIPVCAGLQCGSDGCGGSCGSCDDGNVCNGDETCGTDGQCVAGTPLVCNDGNACNGVETCDTVAGCRPGTPLSCNDGVACNGQETCNPSSGCVSGAAVDCNDGVDCTVDACNEPDGSCSHNDDDCSIPTVSEWGLVVLTLMLLIGAKVYFGRRQAIA